MASALSIVQQLFPNVNKVVDAKKDINIEVTKSDTTSATVRNHKACAMAVACKRKLKLDGVIMSVSTAYLVTGDKATRYNPWPVKLRHSTATLCLSRESTNFTQHLKAQNSMESEEPIPRKVVSETVTSLSDFSTRPREFALHCSASMWCSHDLQPRARHCQGNSESRSTGRGTQCLPENRVQRKQRTKILRVFGFAYSGLWYLR